MRGTSNANVRGSSETRRRRREWLVQTYRANEDVVHIWDVKNGADPEGPPTWVTDSFDGPGLVGLQERWGRVAIWLPACRCYRCGTLLTVNMVQVDRIIPGCEGGKYVRNNIRPNCKKCSESTGGKLGAQRKPRRKK